LPITTNVMSSNPAHCEVYSIQYHVIKFVGVVNFSTNKTDLHDITEILLNVALDTIVLTLYTSKWKVICFIIWCWFHTKFIYFAQFSIFLYVIEMFTILLGQSHYRHWHWYHCILQFLKNVVIIIKAKPDLNRFWLFCVCRLVFLLPKLFNYLASNLLTLSVLDEGYSRNTSCALN